MTSTPDTPPTPMPDLTPAGPRWRFTGVDAVALIALLVGSLAIYLPTARFAFVNYDDPVYVYQNPHVMAGLSGANVVWACRAIVSSNWHPLTLLAELLISTLFGTGPGPFHVANALLHTANVGLLYLFLRRTTPGYWLAVLAAALWGWHPLRVESVAWVSELKDVLCGTFTLLTLLAYARYTTHRTPARYSAVAGLLALAMLAKPMAVTVPIVLLLLDYWPLGRRSSEPSGSAAGSPRPMDPATEPAAEPLGAEGRWWLTRAIEKLPLAAITVADISYEIVTQTRTGSTGSFEIFPITNRLGNAVVSIAEYLRQTVCPTELAIFYPHPAMLGASHPLWAVALSLVVLVGLTAAAVMLARRVPAVAVGWFWFLVMLIPVIGLVQIGEQARADRYTYLPAIGLTIAVVWGFAALRPPNLVRLAGGVAAAAALGLAVVAYDTVGYWKDTQTLFQRALEVDPDNYQAMLVMANRALTDGNVATATPFARRAVDLTGDRTSTPRVVMGLCLLGTGRDADVKPALEMFLAALKRRPIDANAWLGAGRAISRQADIYAADHHSPADVKRRVNDAVDAYRQTLKLDPDNAQAGDLLAELLEIHGRHDEALAAWQDQLDRFPGDPVANGDVGQSLQRSGDLESAARYYRVAVANGDARATTQSGLAWLTAINGASTPEELAAVAPLAKQACDNPAAGQLPFPWYAYSVVLARLDRFDDAVNAGQKALTFAEAHASADPKMATAIRGRLAAYKMGLVAAPSTKPTSAPTFGPTTRRAATAPGR